MRTKVYKLIGVDASTDGIVDITSGAGSTTAIATAQTYTGGTALTLASNDMPNAGANLTLTTVGNLSTDYFNIVGTAPVTGNPVTEQMQGPNDNTVTSVNTYATITSITPVGGGAANVAVSQHFTAATPLTQLITTFPAPSTLTLTSVSNLSAVNFVIHGTAVGGLPQTETLAGPNADTVTSVKTYATVTSIVPSATDAVHSVSAGTTGDTDPSTADVSAGYPDTSGIVAGSPLPLSSSPYVFGSQAVLTCAIPYSGVPTGIPMEVTVTPASGALANTYTIVGRDRWGINVVSEVIATGTGGTAVTSTKVYSTVISITPSVSDTAVLEIGWPERVTTPWVPLNNTRGMDQAEIADVSVDTQVGSPTFVLEGTAEALNSFGVGANQYANQPTYNGDAAPIDFTAVETTFPLEIPQGLQWARLVLTSGAGTSAISRWVRPSF